MPDRREFQILLLAIFWGLGAEIPWNYPYTGSISAVLINTEKGRKFWNECSDRFFSEEERSVERGGKKEMLSLIIQRQFIRKERNLRELYKQKGFEEAGADLSAR